MSVEARFKLKQAISRKEHEMAALIVVREDVCDQLEKLAPELEQLRDDLALVDCRYTSPEVKTVNFKYTEESA